MRLRPSAMMLPQLGILGGVPAPMNERIASVIIAEPHTYVACTSNGATMLGRICRTRINGSVVPAAIAAST